MMSFFAIIIKNFKLLLKSRVNYLIIILAPLLLIILISLTFSSQTGKIMVATYAEGSNEFILGIESNLDKDFNIIKSNSEDECVAYVKNGEVQTCLVISPDLEIGKGKILFHVDYSRINLVYLIIDKISLNLEDKSTEITKDLAEIMITNLESIKEELNSKKTEINDLKDNNLGTQGDIKEVTSSLGSLELYYDKGKFKISDIMEEIDFVNDNSEVENDLKGKINSLEDKIDDVLDILKNVNKTIVKEIDGLSQVNSNIGHNLPKINTIGSSIDGIVKDIESIAIKDSSSISKPINIEIKPLIIDSSNIDSTFSTLIMILIIFSGLILSSGLIIREKTTDASFRNDISPVNPFWFFLGHYVTVLLILFLELSLVFVVVVGYFERDLISILAPLIGLSLLISSIFILLGMFIGYLFRSEEVISLVSISLGILFLFMSNTILPLDLISGFIKQIINYNPFVIGDNILRKLVLFNSKGIILKKGLLLLGGYLMSLVVLNLGALYFSKGIRKFKLKVPKRNRRFIFRKEKQKKFLKTEKRGNIKRRIINILKKL